MIAAISLTLVFVLALTSSASAECAWVLWVSGPMSTKPRNSFQSIQECKEEMHSDRVRRIIDESQQKGVSLIPICLPDTVDPRGVKGN
jgi:hypothetical protein